METYLSSREAASRTALSFLTATNQTTSTREILLSSPVTSILKTHPSPTSYLLIVMISHLASILRALSSLTVYILRALSSPTASILRALSSPTASIQALHLPTMPSITASSLAASSHIFSITT